MKFSILRLIFENKDMRAGHPAMVSYRDSHKKLLKEDE
jgi:hypothetical protein